VEPLPNRCFYERDVEPLAHVGHALICLDCQADASWHLPTLIGRPPENWWEHIPEHALLTRMPSSDILKELLTEQVGAPRPTESPGDRETPGASSTGPAASGGARPAEPPPPMAPSRTALTQGGRGMQPVPLPEPSSMDVD